MSRIIVALATPPLKGALAIIRLSGDGVLALTDTLFTKKVSDVTKGTLFVGEFKDKETIDQVVLLAYPHGKSMTGEESVEVICHGSMVIANQIIEAYISRGVSYATRGEFTSRAFYNGKMDLVEAEAVNDMINATTIEAKNLSLMSLKGSTSKGLTPLRKGIADLLALVEVNIDYPEYDDIEVASKTKIVSDCEELRRQIAKLIDEGNQGQIIKEGIKVAIVGEPNVGKSSLLNSLIEEEKAIVSSIAGTTRDVVEGELSIHGVALHLLDTAGIRESEDEIEKIGVKRSQKSIQEADLVIAVLDARRNELSEGEKEILTLSEGKRRIICYNKGDLVPSHEDGKLYVSALKNDVEPLKEAIFESLGLSEESFKTPSLNNARQLGLLKKIDLDLARAQEDAENDVPSDIVAVSLQSAYNGIREILGEVATNDLSDEIFSRFCVGK
ncbi:MAG: tRNA uridine-5-carboxymethylaminomethyl(34) synthesis GTPase MnmE [Bacilli bacterium]|nr:tRNA uridine-5-carboxymethylaminomethyl(34) synthesis GTPase MnmE [Bacilli bacterium]